MNLAVSDGRKLLIQLVGTMHGIAWEEEGSGFIKSLQKSFRPLISTAVKSNLSAAIKQDNIDIIEVDEHLSELSDTLKEKIQPGFEEYRDMDPYELPEEFAHLQAQDMSKIGFINDIVRGIKKVIVKEAPKPAAQDFSTGQQSTGSTTASA